MVKALPQIGVRVHSAAGGLEVLRVEDVRRLVTNGDHSAALVVPEGYGAQLASGEVPRIQLLRDPAAFITMQMIAGNLMPVLFESTVQNVGPSLMTKALDDLVRLGKEP